MNQRIVTVLFALFFLCMLLAPRMFAVGPPHESAIRDAINGVGKKIPPESLQSNIKQTIQLIVVVSIILLSGVLLHLIFSGMASIRGRQPKPLDDVAIDVTFLTLTKHSEKQKLMPAVVRKLDTRGATLTSGDSFSVGQQLALQFGEKGSHLDPTALTLFVMIKDVTKRDDHSVVVVRFVSENTGADARLYRLINSYRHHRLPDKA